MKLKAVIILLMMAGAASGWGQSTQEHICNEAVKRAWGEGVVSECLPRGNSEFLMDFCKILHSVQPEAYQPCVYAVQDQKMIHPAVMPYELFNDSDMHYDYSSCPIRPGIARLLLCSDPSKDFASSKAREWFSRAGNSSDVCVRAYELCIGSNYLADSKMPLRQVVPGQRQNKCRTELEAMVDDKISGGYAGWRVSSRCTFDRSSYEQYFSVTADMIDKIIDEVADVAGNMSKKPFNAGNQVILLSNAIDYELTPIQSYLTGRGVDVITSNANDFPSNQYKKFIIILGGQNAPEVGEITGTLLGDKEKSYLLSSPESRMVSIKQDVWTQGQTVWILAGYDEQMTQQVTQERQAEIYYNITTQ